MQNLEIKSTPFWNFTERFASFYLISEKNETKQNRKHWNRKIENKV